MKTSACAEPAELSVHAARHFFPRRKVRDHLPRRRPGSLFPALRTELTRIRLLAKGKVDRPAVVDQCAEPVRIKSGANVLSGAALAAIPRNEQGSVRHRRAK